MNNLTLGNDDFTYYETMGGGQGACAGRRRAERRARGDENTLNTPVEALELEFPLRVVEYALRRGSGGAGRHRGGDGVVREVEALAPTWTSRCSPSAGATSRRAPTGGEPGAPRAQPARRRGAAAEGERPLAPGSRLRIETPGGGGHGG